MEMDGDRVEAERSDPDVALVIRSYEAFARGDIGAAVAPLHPQVEWVEPDEFPNGGRRQGPEAVAEYLHASRAMWAKLRSEPTVYRHGDDLVVFHHVSGTCPAAWSTAPTTRPPSPTCTPCVTALWCGCAPTPTHRTPSPASPTDRVTAARVTTGPRDH